MMKSNYAFVVLLLIVLLVTGCGKKTGLEGKVVDGKQETNRSSDGRYEIYRPNRDKVIKDTKTGLMWTPDIGKKGLNWDKAKSAVVELNRNKYGGYNDWRMPTIEELKGIYEDNKRHKALDYPNESWTIGIDPVFDFSGSWVWSSELNDFSKSAQAFRLTTGSAHWLLRFPSSPNVRVIAVRSGG